MFGALIEYAIVNVLARKAKVAADKAAAAKEKAYRQAAGETGRNNNAVHHDNVSSILKILYLYYFVYVTRRKQTECRQQGVLPETII